MNRRRERCLCFFIQICANLSFFFFIFHFSGHFFLVPAVRASDFGLVLILCSFGTSANDDTRSQTGQRILVWFLQQPNVFTLLSPSLLIFQMIFLLFCSFTCPCSLRNAIDCRCLDAFIWGNKTQESIFNTNEVRYYFL